MSLFWNKSAKNDRHPGYPDLPLDLRVGAILNLDLGEILRYEGLDLTVALPQEELIVSGVSSQNLFGMRIARVYANQGEVRWLVQLNCEADGTPKDVSVFTCTQEIYPPNAEEWDVWLGEGGLIGGPDINAPNGKTYQRAWGQGQYMPPVESDEAVYADAKAAPASIAHKMMLYSRDLGDEATEYMFLSADETPDEALVRVWVGVSMFTGALKVF